MENSKKILKANYIFVVKIGDNLSEYATKEDAKNKLISLNDKGIKNVKLIETHSRRFVNRVINSPRILLYGRMWYNIIRLEGC